MNTIKKASDLIKTLFAGMKIEQGEEYYSLFSGWERTAGIDIASHSRIKEIEKGTLIVAADHPGWAQMIHLRKGTILTACRKAYPDLKIRSIRVVLETNQSEKKKPLPKQPEKGKEAEKKAEKKATNPQEREGFNVLLQRLEQAVKEQKKPTP